MPIVQRIEISNFLNSGRVEPWRPDWPHQIFDLGEKNTAMNIPNGKGKSTLMLSLLAMLAGHGKSMKELQRNHYAPRKTGRYTHIRMQVKVPYGETNDLMSMAGGELPGQPMVFGLYANSGENEKINYYSYRGTFENCPVANVSQLRHTLIEDDVFRKQLDECSGLFPSSRKESTMREWIAFVSDFFDMPSLIQQLNYQLARGAEGNNTYFEMTDDKGSSFIGLRYSARIFYKLLAPELLTDVMGELGEDGERGIEDTIHEKIRSLLIAKHNTEKNRQDLERTERTLNGVKGALEKADTLASAKSIYKSHSSEFVTEMTAVKSVLIDNPIPGVPNNPPDNIAEIAKLMVMQNGEWFIPDRVMAEFTNEPAGEVNRRADLRNGITLESANNTQVIDFTCHSFFSNKKRGPASKLYSRESALSLIKVTSNFTREWSLEKATVAITEAFDWVEANADSNPARLIKKDTDNQLGQKRLHQKELNEKLKDFGREREGLRDKQDNISLQQAEYKRMTNSGLFSKEDLIEPVEAGKRFEAQRQKASAELNEHNAKVIRLESVFSNYNKYKEEFGDKTLPIEIAATLKNAEAQAKTFKDDSAQQQKALKLERKSQFDTFNEAKLNYDRIYSRSVQFKDLQPALSRFKSIFNTEPTAGLEAAVKMALLQARNQQKSIEVKRSSIAGDLEALNYFKNSHENIDPKEWLKTRLSNWEVLGVTIQQQKDKLSDIRFRREALDKAAVAPGKIARDVMVAAGGDAIALYNAIEKINLPLSLKEKALTLFSALLHSPVYKTLHEAVAAARALAQKEIEAPVFVMDELEEFCNSGNIHTEQLIAHTWLVGVRTRPVDCLLDPNLVEREKSELDQLIDGLDQRILINEKERDALSPHSSEAELAHKASRALDLRMVEQDLVLKAEWATLENQIPILAERASDEARDAIKAQILFETEFKDSSEANLVEAVKLAQSNMTEATKKLEKTDSLIDQLENNKSQLDDEWAKAVSASQQVPYLNKIQAFIDDPLENPAFMMGADRLGQALSLHFKDCEIRTKFNFEQAQNFIANGADEPRQIEERLAHIKGEFEYIQDKLLPEIENEIDILEKYSLSLITSFNNIDEFIRALIRRFREFQLGLERGEYTLDATQALPHTLSDNGADILETKNPKEQIEMLLALASDMSLMDTMELGKKMREAKYAYDKARSDLESSINIILATSDLHLPEHVKIELGQAIDEPSILNRTYSVTKNNFDKNKAANATAQSYLDKEWGDIGEWLHKFTLRLSSNFDAMCKAFAPGKDPVTKEINAAGFIIKATPAEMSDVRATLDEIVQIVEKDEKARELIDSASPAFRDANKQNLRAQIRDTFYKKVILDPSIHVFMPSISSKPLLLEKSMVSTGQGIAMTLLWIVKMASYISERELLRLTTDRAQLKKLRTTKTQFAIIDGAFSSLSKEDLIRDALHGVTSQHGTFQLIITGHDANYKNNFEYFPTLIQARELNDRIMYADSLTKQLLHPDEVGSYAGSMATMGITKRPLTELEKIST